MRIERKKLWGQGSPPLPRGRDPVVEVPSPRPRRRDAIPTFNFRPAEVGASKGKAGEISPAHPTHLHTLTKIILIAEDDYLLGGKTLARHFRLRFVTRQHPSPKRDGLP